MGVTVTKRYVRSKYSTEAPLWELVNIPISHTESTWYALEENLGYRALPKSEYIEVPAPEVWERCRGDVVAIDSFNKRVLCFGGHTVYASVGYRWAWADNTRHAGHRNLHFLYGPSLAVPQGRERRGD